MENSAGAQQTAACGIAKDDGLVKSRFTDGFAKSSKFRARPLQVESWTFYEVVKER